MALLLVVGMVVQNSGYSRKAQVVVYRNGIEQVAFRAEFSTGSNDDSCSVANPFVWLQRKLQVVEPADREGETFFPLPIGRIGIKFSVRHDIYWELGMNRNNSSKFRHDWGAAVKVGSGALK